MEQDGCISRREIRIIAGRRGVPAHEKLLSPPVPQPLNVFLEKNGKNPGFLKKLKNAQITQLINLG